MDIKICDLNIQKILFASEALRIFSQRYKWKQESDTSKLEEILSAGQESTENRIILIHKQN